MYSTRFCPYCMRARRLLKNKNIEYEEILISSDRALRQEMEQKSGRTSVPQIFINGQAIGGYDDIAKLNLDGKLDILLEEK
ncbi:MAG: glutaredoxin 3 [Cocleimonas sp.]|nr:glutaredoxin 3 [Cocleimonas sp.]